MKKLIFLIIGMVLGVVLYRSYYSDATPNKNISQKVITVDGKVVRNLSVMGKSAYQLQSLNDTTRSYYVIGNGRAPATGEILYDLQLAKYDLVILNDDTLGLYMEQPKSD